MPRGIATLFYTPKLASFQTRACQEAGFPNMDVVVVPAPVEFCSEGSPTFRNALFNSDSRLQFGHVEQFLPDSNGNYRRNTFRGYNREFAALPTGYFVHRCVQSFEERYKAGNNGFLKRIEAAKPEAHGRGIRAV
jgi:hypothetical protein